MPKLERDADTLLPESVEELTEEMKLAGTSNAMNQASPVRDDEVDSLKDGTPGYETTGVAAMHPDLQGEENDGLELTAAPVPRPGGNE